MYMGLAVPVQRGQTTAMMYVGLAVPVQRGRCCCRVRGMGRQPLIVSEPLELASSSHERLLYTPDPDSLTTFLTIPHTL